MHNRKLKAYLKCVFSEIYLLYKFVIDGYGIRMDFCLRLDKHRFIYKYLEVSRYIILSTMNNYSCIVVISFQIDEQLNQITTRHK